MNNDPRQNLLDTLRALADSIPQRLRNVHKLLGDEIARDLRTAIAGLEAQPTCKDDLQVHFDSTLGDGGLCIIEDLRSVLAWEEKRMGRVSAGVLKQVIKRLHDAQDYAGEKK